MNSECAEFLLCSLKDYNTVIVLKILGQGPFLMLTLNVNSLRKRDRALSFPVDWCPNPRV